MNHNENKFDEWKQHYEALDMPDSIDPYIEAGIKKGSRRKKITFRVRISALAMCIMLACFVSAIRISPAFATYVNTIPGIRNLAQLITYDKGLQDALHNNFIQKVNRSVNHDGITFTVNGVIADDSRMILFYSVHSHTSKTLKLMSVDLLNGKGKPVIGGITYDPSVIKKHSSREVTVGFVKSSDVPHTVNFTIHLKKGVKDWAGTVKVPIDKQRFKNMKQVLPVHKTISIGEQVIHFDKAIIYPTRIDVQVHFDPNNSKHIFGFDRMKLVDDKGNVWPIVDGMSGAQMNSNEQMIYFQSNYFHEPKKLYLEGQSMRVLDKNKMNVLVNLKTKKLLKQPDRKLTLIGVTKTSKNYKIKFKYQTQGPKKQSFFHSVQFGSIHDARWKSVQILSSETSNIPELGAQTIQIKIKRSNYKEPLKLHINDYPNHIKKSFRIRIK